MILSPSAATHFYCSAEFPLRVGAEKAAEAPKPSIALAC